MVSIHFILCAFQQKNTVVYWIGVIRSNFTMFDKKVLLSSLTTIYHVYRDVPRQCQQRLFGYGSKIHWVASSNRVEKTEKQSLT